MKYRAIFPALLVILLFASSCVPAPLVSGGQTPAASTAAPSATGAPAAAGTPQSGGTLRYGLTLPVSGIDPHINANSELGIALSSVYDTLVAQAQDGTFHPDLAQSWIISSDGLTYTFKLRQDVTFQDGTPFNAAAVVRNLQRIANPATQSQKAVFMLGPFDHAEAVDNYTVKIVMKQPYAPLLDSLSQVYLGMASPTALDKWGDQYQFHQVGTGPFRMVSYQQGQSLVLERNPDYHWAPDIRQHQGPAYLDRIEFHFYADAATRLPALLSGQADVMGEIPAQDAAQLTSNPAYRLMPVAVPGQPVLFYLNTALPPLDDVHVRQALLYGADRAALVKAVFGPTSPVAFGPLAAVTRGADKSLAGMYPYDPQKAAGLLASAGWTRGADGILAKNGQRLVLKGVLQSWGDLSKIGAILQAQWKTLGIDLQLETMSYPAALEAGRKGTYHLYPSVNSGTDPDLLRPYFISSDIGGVNWSRVNDPQLDAWFKQAAELTDWSQRLPLYTKIQQTIMQQAWVLPIRDQVNLNASSTRVQGLTYDVQGWWPVLYDVWVTK
jgi:peptide/nickel transport system substrate-binding protein